MNRESRASVHDQASPIDVARRRAAEKDDVVRPSSTVVARCSGDTFLISSPNCGTRTMLACIMGVSTHEGQMALSRMCFLRQSIAYDPLSLGS